MNIFQFYLLLLHLAERIGFLLRETALLLLRLDALILRNTMLLCLGRYLVDAYLFGKSRVLGKKILVSLL